MLGGMRTLLAAVVLLGLIALLANRYLPLRSLWHHGSLQSSSSCKIKGKISASGRRIYHVPGQPYYDATRIDVARGERWFCSEAEAQAAGWQKAHGYK